MVIKKATPLKVYERDIQILNHLKASLENVLTQILKSQISYNPVDTGRKLNLHKTFRRRPELTQDVRKTSWTSFESLMYVQFTSCICGKWPFLSELDSKCVEDELWISNLAIKWKVTEWVRIKTENELP